MQIIHLLLYHYFIFLDSSSGPDHLSALQIWEGCFWWAEAITITIIRFNVFQLLLKTTFSLIYHCFTFNLPKPAASPPFSLLGSFFCLLLKRSFFSYKTPLFFSLGSNLWDYSLPKGENNHSSDFAHCVFKHSPWNILPLNKFAFSYIVSLCYKKGTFVAFWYFSAEGHSGIWLFHLPENTDPGHCRCFNAYTDPVRSSRLN